MSCGCGAQSQVTDFALADNEFSCCHVVVRVAIRPVESKVVNRLISETHREHRRGRAVRRIPHHRNQKDLTAAGVIYIEALNYALTSRADPTNNRQALGQIEPQVGAIDAAPNPIEQDLYVKLDTRLNRTGNRQLDKQVALSQPLKSVISGRHPSVDGVPNVNTGCRSLGLVAATTGEHDETDSGEDARTPDLMYEGSATRTVSLRLLAWMSAENANRHGPAHRVR